MEITRYSCCQTWS